MVTVMVADDHPLVLRGVVDLLEEEQDFEVIATAFDGAAALAAIEQERPDVAVLDVSMPGLNGLEVLREVARTQPQVRVVFLTAWISSEDIADAVAAGVHGILRKESAPEALVNCLRDVCGGQRWLPSDIVQPAINQRANPPAHPKLLAELLTPREIEIALLVSEGLSNKEVARKKKISEGTVKLHLHSIYHKSDIQNRTSLAAFVLAQRFKEITSS